MKRPVLTMKRSLVLTLAALSTLSALPAVGAEPVDAPQGKRVDNARLESRTLPPPAEWQPVAAYPLPSGVTREHAAALRAGMQSLPTQPAAAQLAFNDQRLGALFASGKADLLPATKTVLDAVIARYQGKAGLRLAVVGHTDNQGLSPRAQKRFGDNAGLSDARALAVVTYLQAGLGLSTDKLAMAGKGASQPIASNRTAAGMAQNRRVVLTVWHDAPVVALPQSTAPVAGCAAVPSQGLADLPFRITVDGEALNPTEVPATNEADRQRCTDVALEKADIQIKYDDLAAKPTLNVWTEKDLAVRGQTVTFRGYANYVAWLKTAEVRVFKRQDRVDGKPLVVLPLAWEKPTTWMLPAEGTDEYQYVLRVTDAEGRFDETAVKTLNVASRTRALADLQAPSREALTGWGENALLVSNISVHGGTVSVSGRDFKPTQSVEILGLPVPVGNNGRFAFRQILPAGAQSVDVTVTDADGKAVTFRRNVSIPDSDWFYVAVGDLTLGNNSMTGSRDWVTGDIARDAGSYATGRGAFYLKGKIKGDWLLTAAVDTREQALKDVLSNFSSKDPRYLLRNIDPNVYYPVYGDDSTSVDDAPTRGKFYVRLERGDSHVMWGNFQTQWAGSELIQYSRGLYGAKARYRSEATTGFGERQTSVEAFAADPGTLGAREEFRGTGGSLYYFRHQDMTRGSERLWAEVRDKDSGLVIERRQLSPGQDYEINYLQGRVMLREPLPSTATGSGLIYTGSLSGHPLYLVSTYEYVPGLTEVSNQSFGLRATHWLNNMFQVGVTGYRQGEDSSRQTLTGLDFTTRFTAGSSLKMEIARATGVGSPVFGSINGGFGFDTLSGVSRDAMAKRLEAKFALADVVEGGKGQVNAYWQDRQRGFSAPGQLFTNGEAVRQVGAQGVMGFGAGNELLIKADDRRADSQDLRGVEVAVKTPLSDAWAVSAGVRVDARTTHLANASPILSQNGDRTDVLLRADYVPNKPEGAAGEKDDWSVYGFVQGTLAHTGNRPENDRLGVGGKYRVNDRLSVLAEASEGSLGVGGRLGAEYRLSDRSNAYLSYRLENENPDTAYRGRMGSWVSGADYRVSSEVRLFGETRLTHGAGPESLTQAFGVDLAPNDRWTVGLKTEFGTISDPLAGDLRRTALGGALGYKFERTTYSGSLEYRTENGTTMANTQTHRDVWLLRNNLGYQLDPAWRLLGKLNVSRSNNSQGAFYDGNFHELVVGAAYRPIDNDRWNTLFKYTNFYNLPSPGQLSSSGLSIADYAQRSQVLSVDTIWDAKPWLSLGVKYGVRIGELRATKVEGDWFRSRADLLVLRADWHFVKEWDAVAELRKLRATEAQDARAGMLLGVYRHVDKHVKVGVGYNFTRYSDDLTDLSYRSKGWFLNVVGTM